MNSCKGSVTRFYQCVTHCSKLQPQTQHTVSSSLRFNTTPTCAISKAPVHFSPSLGFVPALSLETVPTVVCLTTALSRPFQQDCRHLPLSAHLSFFQARLSTASSFCPSLLQAHCAIKTCNRKEDSQWFSQNMRRGAVRLKQGERQAEKPQKETDKHM